MPESDVPSPTADRPPLILAAEEPPEPEPEKAAQPAGDTPQDADPEAGQRYPAWADIPSWKPGQGPPSGRQLWFVAVKTDLMAKKTGGKIVKLKDGKLHECRQLLLWELSLQDEKQAFGRAGGDPNRAGAELAKQMVRAVDGVPVSWADERSPDHPIRIWTDLGPKYRNLLTRLYTAIHVLGEKETLDFFENGVELRTPTS